MSDDTIQTVAFMALLAIFMVCLAARTMFDSWLDYKKKEKDCERD